MVAFEAAVAGGIPIIKALREGLTANRIEWIAGIINGTCNFILSEMRDKGAAVRRRAEGGAGARLRRGRSRPSTSRASTPRTSSPSSRRSRSAFRCSSTRPTPRASRSCTARTSATPRSSATASSCSASRGATTHAGIELRVHPTLIPARRLIANVEGVMNAILVKGDAVGATLYYGAGAGAEPTASAVVADLVDVTRMHHRRSRASRAAPRVPARPALRRRRSCRWARSRRRYYLRMRVLDRPGVLADITRILADSRHLHRRDDPEGARRGRGARSTSSCSPTSRSRRTSTQAIAKIEALPTVRGQGRAHPAGSRCCSALRLRPAATRAEPQPLRRRSCSKASRPTAGSPCPKAYPRIDRRARRCAAWPIATSPSGSCRASWTTSRRDLAPHRARDLHRARFGSDEITPLTTLEPGLHLLRLSNGPTLAFKDIALQLLGSLFEHVLERRERDAEHPGRDVGRHRLCGGVRDARQEGHRACSCCRRTGA